MVAKRLGVGAAPSASATENVSEDWTKSIKKQILSVGKKRRHDNIYDQEDDDDDAADNNYHESSSDEEEGRTTAVKERKKKKITPVSVDTTSSEAVQGDVAKNDTKSKKKKKKGKKERSQEKQSIQDGADLNAPADAVEKQEETTEVVTNTDESKKSNKKRKRPKVRSRQKNIAKDNRAANDKPSHLVPGRGNYAGRAMTQTTREKLGLGKSKSSMKSKKKSVRLDDAFEKGEWVDTDGLKEADKPAPVQDNSNDVVDSAARDDIDVGESVKEGTSLKKIGDCIVDYEPSSSSTKKKKTKKDKKKKKYKNV